MSLCHMSAKNHMCFYLLLNDLLSISKQLWKNEAVYWISFNTLSSEQQILHWKDWAEYGH